MPTGLNYGVDDINVPSGQTSQSSGGGMEESDKWLSAGTSLLSGFMGGGGGMMPSLDFGASGGRSGPIIDESTQIVGSAGGNDMGEMLTILQQPQKNGGLGLDVRESGTAGVRFGFNKNTGENTVKASTSGIVPLAIAGLGTFFMLKVL